MDYTQFSALSSCEELYRLKWLKKLRKVDDNNSKLPLLFGCAGHSGLENYYKGGTVASMKEAFLAAYLVVPPDEETVWLPENGLKVMEEYQSWAKAQDAGMEILGVEEVFKVPMGSIEWEGKIDLVVRNSAGIWWIDHKFTQSYLDEHFWKRFQMSGQLSGYTWYLTQKYGHCNGGYINAIRCSHRSRAYKGEPAGFYCQFDRQMFNRNSDQVDAWYQNVLKVVNRLNKSSDSVWPREDSGLQCRRCEFLDLCLSNCDEQIMEMLYENYNPFQYLEV